MTTKQDRNGKPDKARGFRLSLDGWAVTLALFLPLLMGLGVIKKIPW